MLITEVAIQGEFLLDGYRYRLMGIGEGTVQAVALDDEVRAYLESPDALVTLSSDLQVEVP